MELCATLFLLFNELNFSQDGMRQLCHASENNTLRRNVCALDVLSCTHIHYTHAHMCTPLPHLQHMHPNPSQEAHILFLLHFPKTSSFFFFAVVIQSLFIFFVGQFYVSFFISFPNMPAQWLRQEGYSTCRGYSDLNNLQPWPGLLFQETMVKLSEPQMMGVFYERLRGRSQVLLASPVGTCQAVPMAGTTSAPCHPHLLSLPLSSVSFVWLSNRVVPMPRLLALKGLC